MALPDSFQPGVSSPSVRSAWRARLPTFAIAVLGSLASLAVFLRIQDSQAESDSLRFQRLVERVATRVAEITRRYEYGLRGGRGLFAASEHVTPREWQRYVESHGMASEFPGALGFGVVRRVKREDLPAFEQSIRAEGLPEFRVNSSGLGAEVLPITYIEPLERNPGALGQDIALRPDELEAAERAMLSGRAALSAPIRHLQEDEQWGFMYFLPCYAHGAPTETEAERRAALEGWIYAPIVMDRLLAGIATQLEYQVDFEVFDQASPDAHLPLFDWDGDPHACTTAESFERGANGRLTARRTVEVGQRRWSVCVSSLPAFHAKAQGWLSWAVLAGGTLASLLLALFVNSQHAQRARAEALVELRTRELLEKNRWLEAARASADAATRSKSEFLANMSHEIRTPMTAILGFAELLRDPDCSALERREHLQTIQNNGNHLLSIVNDILDLSKIEAGKMQVESIPCSPLELVDEAVRLLAQRARAKDIALVVRWPERVPERIRSDPLRARQVLLNLLGNALKFTERGEVRIESTFDEAPGQAAFWTFRVHDTGIGMDERQLEQVFQPFTQADGSTTRRFGGSGLGLPISRRLCELLGGSLSGECQLGKGCTFVARIATGPLADVPRVAPPRASAAA